MDSLMQATFHFQLSSTRPKKQSTGCPLDTCRPLISFICFSPFPFLLSLRIHLNCIQSNCELFVHHLCLCLLCQWLKERGSRKSSDRKNAKASLCAEGGGSGGGSLCRGGCGRKRARGSRSSRWEQGEGLVDSDRAGEVKEDCHRNDVRDKAIIP